MELKVISISALAALALAGTASFQSASAEPSDDDFNLAFPSEESAEPVNADGFNLRMPGEPLGAETDDFNLASDVMTSNGLSGLPEFDTSALEAPEEEAPEDDLDAIIRLDD